MFVELPQHLVALSEEEIDLPGRIIRFRDEWADGFELLLGGQPAFSRHQQSRLKDADCWSLIAVKLRERINRLLRLVEPACLQQNVAKHLQQRRLARLRRQALAENGHGRLDIPTLNGNGSHAPVGTLVVGIELACLGCDPFCGVMPLFRH